MRIPGIIRRVRTGGATGVVAALLASPVPGAAVTAQEVVNRVQAGLTESRTFSARFEKRFYWAALDKGSSRQGRIYLERPNRFRLEVEGGDLVVADGQAVWTYSPQNEQAVVSPYQGQVMTPWEVLLDYAAGFAPVAVQEVELGGRPCYLLLLEPQAEDAVVAGMRVWVERATYLVQQVEQTETDGNITTYVLSDQRVNTRLKDDLFRFTPPAGVEVVDRRGPAPGDR
ncbi:MAG: outer membrane lipoprotein chaperone LolA [Candidatus Latescibacterota bacterium]